MFKARHRIYTIRDFRKLPEVEPSLEFFGGRVIQKIAGGWPHSIIQGEMMFALDAHTKEGQAGMVLPSLRTSFGGDSHVFDLCYFVEDRQPGPHNPQDLIEVLRPPDLAIEILAPGQSVAELTCKLRSAIRRKVRLGWLIDDRLREVHVLRPVADPQVLRSGDSLDGEDVIPGFTLPIAELFGWLDGHRGRGNPDRGEP